MSVRDDLINQIENATSAAATLGYAVPSQTNDIYENYIWAICLQAARDRGANITYETVHETPASLLIFRTSPGAIYSVAHNYTHAVVEFGQRPPLEVHVGTRVTGKSRVLHECDVAVIYRDEARLCRAEQVHPRAARILMAMECKFYTSSLQLHLGRGYIGLTRDIHVKERYFITNSSSDSVAKLIDYHQSEWDFDVLPSNYEAVALRHRFARAFRNFIAKQ